MEIFNFDVAIGSSATTDFKVNVVKFGDGYEQRQPQGLTPILEDWNVEVVGTKEHIDTIKAFLDKHAGYKAFLWRVTPDEPLKKYKATKYTRKPKGGSIWIISWTMEEVLA